MVIPDACLLVVRYCRAFAVDAGARSTAGEFSFCRRGGFHRSTRFQDAVYIAQVGCECFVRCVLVGAVWNRAAGAAVFLLRLCFFFA
jgi:hypothetical protein